ncbi:MULTISPECIES: ComGF family competence protein [Staphylococcus]|uniref:ComGF family competence protein n=1 Tax=Staphylococcus hsinchuensis TaxID=3051183 RepID=A0ABZ3ECI2_9STAP|nr:MULTISPECIES: ComGF family competence protein [unclassified Staphylococcus]
MKNVIRRINAFTYIEAIFTLFITVLILSVVPILIKTSSTIHQVYNNPAFVELEFYAYDMTKDLQSAKNAEFHTNISNDTLIMKTKHRITRYEFKNFKIVKTINGGGNITMLNNVLNVRYEIKNKTIVVHLKLLESGHKFEKTIYF